MKVETIIMIYGTICFCLIIFNIIYNLMMRFTDPNLEYRLEHFQKKIARQMQNAAEGKEIQKAHLNFIYKKLRHVNNLVTFDKILNRELEENTEQIGRAYLDAIRPVFLRLSVDYLKKDNAEAAYFTYFIAKHMSDREHSVDSLQGMMLEYVKKEQLYCRINSLQALYQFGNEESVLDGLYFQDDNALYMSPKILTEGLLSFTGDHERLITYFWQYRKEFTVGTQLGILNYIRFKTGGYAEEMKEIMNNPREDKELRLCAIRYFGKYPNEEAKEALMQFAQDKNNSHWEYVTVSIASLSRYPGEDVVAVLKDALHSSNWYIRFAASESIDAHRLHYMDLMDILAGSDRYAREIMQYRLEAHKLQRKGVDFG